MVTSAAVPVSAPPAPGNPRSAYRALLVGAGAVLAAIVVLALTADETNEYVRTADVLGLDPGWAPWLVPVAGTTGTLSAVAVVGLLLARGFLTDTNRSLRPAAVAAYVWTAVTAIRIVAGAAELFATPVRDALHPAKLTYFLTEVPTGQALLITFVLTVFVAVGCQSTSGSTAAAALTVLATIAVLPPVASGHASTAGNHQVIVSALMLHAASAVVWTGGLFALVLEVRRPRADAVRRFSTLALWCFAITVVTGVVSAAARLERWSDFTSSLYGMIILAKAAALVALGAFGVWHRRRSLPALAAGQNRVFVRVAVVELFVLAATMGLAVALGRTPPPNELGHIVFDTPLTPLIRWTPEPLLLVLAVVAVTAYVTAVRKADAWPWRSTALWVVGWALLVATGTARLADLDPSGTVRVVQAATVALVVPALLMSARPGRLAQAAGWSRIRTTGDARELRLLRSPAVAVTLYSATGFLVVLAAANTWADSRHGVHLLVHLGVVAAGCLTWSPPPKTPSPVTEISPTGHGDRPSPISLSPRSR